MQRLSGTQGTQLADRFTKVGVVRCRQTHGAKRPADQIAPTFLRQPKQRVEAHGLISADRPPIDDRKLIEQTLAFAQMISGTTDTGNSCGKAFLHERQHGFAQEIAGKAQIRIALILDPVEAAITRPGKNRGTIDAQHRPQQGHAIGAPLHLGNPRHSSGASPRNNLNSTVSA